MRIVSLLPAATEIVWALGLGDDLLGVSHACDHPPAVRGRPVLTRPAETLAGIPAHEVHALAAAAAGGGPPLVGVDGALLASLRPDLVLAGPMPAAAGAALAGALRAAVGPEAAIVTLAPTSLVGIFHAIATVGAMAAAEDEAVGLVEILRERLADVEEVVEERRDGGHHAPRVVMLEWRDPLVAAGLWSPEQVRRGGGGEVLGADGEPAARADWDAVVEVDPEMLLLLPCGMHLGEVIATWRATPRPPAWDELQAVRRGQVFALDASAYFSRPGPRVIDGVELLAEIFDPAAFIDRAPVGSWVPVL